MFCRKLCRYGLNLLLAVAVSHGVYANAAEIDHRENQAEYMIYLDADGSHTPAMRRAAQENVVRKLQEADTNLRVLARATILDNALYVQTDANPAWLLADTDDVSIVSASGQPVAPHATDAGSAQSTTSRAFVSDNQSLQSRLDTTAALPSVQDVGTRNSAVRVAILSTGVDYTHSALGGSGSPEDYAAAVENSRWAWSGFPTATVAGRDFVSSSPLSDFYGEDHNPIEQAISADGYPFGEGTAMASVVRRLAPAASIVALKIANIELGEGRPQVNYITQDWLLFALEYAIDPNHDGDTSDRADILVLPSHYVYDAYRIFEIDSSEIGLEMHAHRLQAMATLGTLVITDVGRRAGLGKYGLVAAAGARDALAVGYVVDGENVDAPVLASESVQGPVGRSERIKPDLVAWMKDTAVAIPGAGTELGEMSAPEIATATIAGHAAQLMSTHPDLSALEIKNLLVQTADSDVVRLTDSPDALVAEPTAVGSGLVNIERALNTELVAWEQGSMQPSLAFGVQEIADTETFIRKLRVRNLSNASREVAFAVQYADESDANGLDWTLPDAVHLGPGESRSVELRLTVNAEGLGEWPLVSSDDYHMPENWRRAERDGRLLIGDGTLNMAWMIKPRPASGLQKHFDTLVEYNLDPTLFGEGFGIADATSEYSIELTNESATSTLYGAFPIIHREPVIKSDRANAPLAQLQATGGGIYPDAACRSGQKLVLAARMWHPLVVGFGMEWDTYTEDIVEERGMRNGVEAWMFVNVPDEQRGFIVTAGLDEHGNPVTTYMNMRVPSGDPQRWLQSTLPTYMTPDGRNILSQVCLDNLYHHDFAAPEDFDHDLGWVLRPGLWDYPDVYTPIIEHNLLLGGLVTYVRDWLGQLSEAVSGARVGLRLPVAGETDSRSVPPSAYSSLLEVGPGERFLVHAVRDYLCPFCGEVLLLSFNDSSGLWSPVHYLDDDGEIVPHVVAGQAFDVSESAPAGPIGKVRLDTPGLFALDPETGGVGVTLMNTLPGEPFTVTAGGEIVLANPGSLDYETHQNHELELRLRNAVAFGSPASVRIDVQNENDNPPEQTAELPVIKVGEKGTAIALDLRSYFTDADNDPMTFTADDLPTALSLNSSSGWLEGTLAPADGNVLFAVSDGQHSVSAQLTAESDSPSDGNGGGGAFNPWGLFLLLALMARRVRLLRRLEDSSMNGIDKRPDRALHGAIMRKFVTTTLLFLTVSLAAVAVDAAPVSPGDTDGHRRVPGDPDRTQKYLHDDSGRILYYVELHDLPLAAHAAVKPGYSTKSGTRPKLDVNTRASREYRQKIAVQQTRLLSTAAATTGRTMHAINQYDTVLNGVTLYLADHERESIAALPEVNRVLPLPVARLQTDSGPRFVGAPALWEGIAGDLSTRGDEVVVGIIDSGITPLHPAFADVGGDDHDHVNPRGEVYGDCELAEYAHLCNDKLIGIVSFPALTSGFENVGLLPIGMDYNGHGTHVASTVAGNIVADVPVFEPLTGEPVESGFIFPVVSGVAPHANIISYQVCDQHGACDTSLTIEALEHAVEAGVDVVNYSVGGSPTDPWNDAHSLAFLNARAAGIHVATSAGNSGPSAGTIGNPANAPWITAVAAATHDRGFSDVILDGFSGGLEAPRGRVTGAGVTGEFGGAVVYAGSFGNPYCDAFGADDQFNGEIVLCDRGANIPRIQKGVNVRDAGGGGMILANEVDVPPEFPEFSELFADFHVIPAVAVAAPEGAMLKRWLLAGDSHVARINANVPQPDARAADVVAVFSSRGPVSPEMNTLVPHIAAPGVDIYAAFTDGGIDMDGGSRPYSFLNGTSMSSPHVAGAMALLAAQHDDWTPAELQSALMMTAEPGMQAEFIDADEGLVIRPAGLYAEGAGSMRVDRATAAGLVLDVTEQEYLESDPAAGGNAADLNMPAMVRRDCVINCRFVRRFRATRPGLYDVSLTTEEPDFSVGAEPSQIDVDAGEIVEVEFNVRYTGSRENEDLFAAIELHPAGDEPLLRLPVVVRFKPGHAPAVVQAVTGRSADVIAIPGLVTNGTDTLQSSFVGFAPWQPYQAAIPGDATPTDIWDEDFVGPFQHVVFNVYPGTALLAARIADGAESGDLDLYVYREVHLDGKPTPGAELPLCTSAGPDSNEHCEIENPLPGQYLVMVHNFGGSPDTLQQHVTEVATVMNNGAELDVFDPGALETGEETILAAYFEQPTTVGTDMMGMLTLGTRADAPDNIGDVVVNMQRGPNDVVLLLDGGARLGGDPVVLNVEIAANGTGVARTLVVELPLPDGLSSSSASHDGVITEEMVRWEIDRPVDALSETLVVTLNTSAVESAREIPLAAEHFVVTPFVDTPVEMSDIASLVITQLPVARINGQESVTVEGQAGSQVTLRATGSSGATSDSVLTYAWHQTGGPDVSLGDPGGESIVLTVPDNDSALTFELVVSSDGYDSAPATATVRKAGEKKSGGGGTEWFMLTVLLGVGLRRKQ